MGKTSKWIKHLFLAGNNKDKSREFKSNSTRGTTTENPTTKEKRRWSFRRSSVGAPPQVAEAAEHTLAVAAATSAVADVIRLAWRRRNDIEEEAIVKIQSVFRGYLARKALGALRGLVKLQALVRGHLVRKQAAATLRCMQALVTVQERARMQRIKIIDDYSLDQIRVDITNQRQSNYRNSAQENIFRPTYNETDFGIDENIKIVEMDYGNSKTSTKVRDSYSYYSHTDHRFSTQSVPTRVYPSKPDRRDISPAPSAMSTLTEIMIPRSCSNHFEEYHMNTAQSSPQCYSAISKPHEYSEYGPASLEYTFNPSYMANTESSRAKARSQSAPKSRPDNINPSFERQTSKRRPSVEGRNVPRAVRMQRSSSQAGYIAQNNYHYPWSVKLDKSCVSLEGSECGSTSTVLTDTQYCRSLAGFEVSGNRH